MRTAWVVALVALVSGCEGEPALRKVAATGFFDPPEVDFGVRNVGVVHERQTSLTNTSGRSIQVQAIRFQPTSDAFLPRRADDRTLRGTTLAPGDRVELVVRYRPEVEGDDDVVMTVVFADFEVDVEIFALARALAPPAPMVTPTRIEFTDVPLNSEVAQGIQLANAGQTDATLVAIEASPPFLVRSMAGQAPSLPSTLPSEASAAFEVVYAPTRLGRADGSVVFAFENDQVVQLLVSGDAAVAGTLTCAPSTLDFGDVSRGLQGVQTVNCEVTDGSYRLADAAWAPGSSPSFRLDDGPVDVDASGRLSFDVRFVSDSLPRQHRGTFNLVASHGAVTPVLAEARTVAPDRSLTTVAIEMAWNTRTDFDLHLVRAEGRLFDLEDDCHWRSKNPEWGEPDDGLDDPFLDRDDTDGFGPETINLARPGDERYDVYVQYFDHQLPASVATGVFVDVALNGEPPVRYERIMDDCGVMWHVGEIAIVDEAATFRPRDVLSEDYRNVARCP